MKYRAILTRRAVRDIDEVSKWYEVQGPTLGAEFRREMVDMIDTILERPQSFPEVANGIRGNRSDRFPYKIYYPLRGTDIRILAVYHLARDPNRWNDPNR